jgi:uncharacterized protein YjbI with pentapeptide repeats
MNPDHCKILLQGASSWNAWRRANPTTSPDLSRIRLGKFDLTGADLTNAELARAELQGINLSLALLSGADLRRADLSRANLVGADLTNARLYRAGLTDANLEGADLREADLGRATLGGCSLYKAKLQQATLEGADLGGADLTSAILTGADLSRAQLIRTNLTNADITNCRVYGTSVWGVCLSNAIQTSLIITPDGEPSVEVDNLEVAQFVYLLLNNERIRYVIDTITSKVVLILGRFTPGRKLVLDRVRRELREFGYSPILFDFDRPTNLDLSETITLLARMARFILADITDPKSVPHELASIVPELAVPIVPLLEGNIPDPPTAPYSMFRDLRKYSWVLAPHRYTSQEGLITSLLKEVVGPAEAKRKELLRIKNEAEG